MTFPGAGAQIYRNEAGEVTGWDYLSEPDYDPDDYLSGDEDYDDEGQDEPEATVTLAELTKRFGLPDTDQAAVASWTGDPNGTVWTEAQAQEMQEIWEDDQDDPDPQEPDDAETSWQEYGREEAYADAEMARYDDDPNPYEGTYSEM